MSYDPKQKKEINLGKDLDSLKQQYRANLFVPNKDFLTSINADASSATTSTTETDDATDTDASSQTAPDATDDDDQEET